MLTPDDIQQSGFRNALDLYKNNLHNAQRCTSNYTNTRLFYNEIAQQPIDDASLTFLQLDPFVQESIIDNAKEPLKKTTFRLLQLQPAQQEDVISYILSGPNSKRATEKFRTHALCDSYEMLAVAKEHEKASEGFDLSTLFLLQQENNEPLIFPISEKTHLSPIQVTYIRSLPQCIKQHCKFSEITVTRDYERKENFDFFIEENKKNTAF